MDGGPPLGLVWGVDRLELIMWAGMALIFIAAVRVASNKEWD